MISIIVPVYNVEKYLDKCVRSILCQTYKDFEIILVDDGSLDNSGSICDKVAKEDSRIIVIHQENMGQAGARNAGLDIARGEYIAFVDSDDTVQPYMLEILMDMILKPQCDLAICGYQIVQEKKYINKNFQIEVEEKLNVEQLWEEVFGKLNNAVWNKLYKRELIGENRFPLDLVHGEDLIFNLNYLIRCREGRYNKIPCYNYLKRENSVTTASFSEKNLMEITSKDEALKIVSKYQSSQILNAKKFCYRARTNVVRNILKSKLDKQYSQIIDECINYTKKNYIKIKNSLKLKERFEYYLSTSLFEVYKIIVQLFW